MHETPGDIKLTVSICVDSITFHCSLSFIEFFCHLNHSHNQHKLSLMTAYDHCGGASSEVSIERIRISSTGLSSLFRVRVSSIFVTTSSPL